VPKSHGSYAARDIATAKLGPASTTERVPLSDFILIIAQFALVMIVLALALWIATDLNRTYPAAPQELVRVNKWRGRLWVLITLLFVVVLLQVLTIPIGLIAAFPELF